MIEQTYRIDMIPDGAPVVVHVSQYDTAARRLSFELYNGGVAYELPAGAVASIAGTKPDNTSFLYAMTVSGNIVSIDLKQQMALVAGDVPAEIQITGAEGKIGSANFIIRVERGPIDENTVISETDLPIFEQLVSDAQEAASDAQTAADTASAAASSVASIVPTNIGTDGQILTKRGEHSQWEDVDDLTEIIEEMLPLTYNGKGVNIYFRKWGNILSILFMKENESMTLPTTWTRLGTLTNIKPSSGSTRYIPFITSNGLTGTFKLWADGGVTFLAHSSNPYWMQSSATVVL